MIKNIIILRVYINYIECSLQTTLKHDMIDTCTKIIFTKKELKS